MYISRWVDWEVQYIIVNTALIEIKIDHLMNISYVFFNSFNCEN